MNGWINATSGTFISRLAKHRPTEAGLRSSAVVTSSLLLGSAWAESVRLAPTVAERGNRSRRHNDALCISAT